MTIGRLIALCSPAMGSGKTTLADHMVTHRGWTRLSFATPLKMMTSSLLHAAGVGIVDTQRYVYGDRKEDVIPELGVSSRRLQQTIGTEWGRQCIRESFWTDIAITRADQLRAQGRNVIVDDMRFPNEYDAILAAGGEAYRIVRPGTEVTVSHASEGQLDGIEMEEIWNNATMAEFLAAADRAIFA